MPKISIRCCFASPMIIGFFGQWRPLTFSFDNRYKSCLQPVYSSLPLRLWPHIALLWLLSSWLGLQNSLQKPLIDIVRTYRYSPEISNNLSMTICRGIVSLLWKMNIKAELNFFTRWPDTGVLTNVFPHTLSDKLNLYLLVSSYST